MNTNSIFYLFCLFHRYHRYAVSVLFQNLASMLLKFYKESYSIYSIASTSLFRNYSLQNIVIDVGFVFMFYFSLFLTILLNSPFYFGFDFNINLKDFIYFFNKFDLI